MNDRQIEFLPFHAINEFMRPDFRLALVRNTLTALQTLPDSYRNSLDRLIKKHVKIPGFRQADKAPLLIKTIPVANAFEKKPDLVAAILLAWAESRSDLRAQVYQVLTTRGWKTFSTEEGNPILDLTQYVKEWSILPLEIDRSKLPGFRPTWPQGEDYEAIYQTFNDHFPDANASIDEVSLMVVWLSCRLPYSMEEKEAATGEDH